ncbi:hypothetical protein SKAU_G00217170 [Synaphobranchus kaupii]|uniref:C-type lectin domain-containing protein n=1 Tax=Synaphobranchus kaupii TaxID=118154 RepID=A0A9Q1ITH8_SYNKA|nr:hypothetical protein SKAU_G00217170 [Synaphobranchus kaupii]
MENIAYYDSNIPIHKLIIAALKSITQVNITIEDQIFKQTYVMPARHTLEVTLPSVVLDKFNSSYKTVRVTSNFPVTVLSGNLKSTSIDFGLVQPVQNLGKEYRLASPATPTHGLYQFVVINTQFVNTVTVSQSSQEPFTVTLGPYENARFQSEKYPASTHLTAKTPVAVLFGHPCSELDQCKCSMLFEQLTPVSSWGTVFIVPSLSLSQRNQSFLLVTSDGTGPESITPSEYLAPPSSSGQLELTGSSQYIQAPMPVSVNLLEPGLMALIPEESFSTCYLVHTFQWTRNYILIVVKTTDKEGVRLGEQPLPSSVSWAEVDMSDYSVGLVNLGSSSYMNRAIWHLTSKMGVYIIWRHNTHPYSIFASPAASLKVEPDGSKCRAYLGVVNQVQEEKSWADAQEHCWNLNSQLASLNSINFLHYVGRELGEAQQSSVWVGLRRSLLSGEWRWLNREPMEFSKWGSGEPNSSLITQCAMMSLEPKERLTWNANQDA